MRCPWLLEGVSLFVIYNLCLMQLERFQPQCRNLGLEAEGTCSGNRFQSAKEGRKEQGMQVPYEWEILSEDYSKAT